jgi:hypothetical protein
MRLKFPARQSFIRKTTDPKAGIEDTDNHSPCGAINKASYERDLANASPAASARFEKFGQKIVTKEDKPPTLPIGPGFILGNVEMKDVQVNGRWEMHVTATGFKTGEGGILNTIHPGSDGYHYCKILSPARAMEHIYVDGLRK